MDVSASFKKLATPDASEFPRRMAFGLEDSGYLSATPGSAGLPRILPDFSFRRNVTQTRANLASSVLFTPDIMKPATKKRFAKGTLKKCKSFPVSAFDSQDEGIDLDFQPKKDGWLADEDFFSIPEDQVDDPNNFSMYDMRNVVNDDSMDVADFSDSMDLALEDELYNDSVIEKVHAKNRSIGVNTEDGMQLLHTKLTAFQLASQATEGVIIPTWRNHYGHGGYPKVNQDLCGKKTIDFFSLLAVQSEHTHIVGKILAYLTPKDLEVITHTCNDYATVVKTNKEAKQRLAKYLNKKMQEKENLKVKKQRFAHGEHSGLSETTNRMEMATVAMPICSPPITPTKRRFQSFVHAARNVKPGDQLTECPLCNQPATVDSQTLNGKCSRQFCGHEFCTVCRRAMHLDSPCAILDSPQAKRIRMMVRVGSKQSKRNLQRL